VLQDQDLVQMVLDGLLAVAVDEETLETIEQEEEQVHQVLLLHMLVLVMDLLLILLIVNMLIQNHTR
jgi:hypothetical protein